MGVRYRYIERLILEAYSIIPFIDFPMEPSYVIDRLPNCRSISYQTFAEINHCSLDEVIQLCESKSGCTHYDRNKDRYLILFNEEDGSRSNTGRRRWTKSHELGHVMCKHHKIIASNKLSRDGMNIFYGSIETEADFFASQFLAPFPLFKQLAIHSESDVKTMFGLSDTAAANRYRAYEKWLQYEMTDWDRQIVNLFRDKWNIYS